MTRPPRVAHERSIGLLSLSLTLVGMVVGAGLFALPGELARTAGPAVVLAFAAAGVVGLLFCAIAALLGNAFPVNGASFIAVALMLNPTLGFLMAWMLLLALPVSASLLAHSFAEYLQSLAPTAARMPVAIALIAAVTGLNLLRTSAVVGAQVLMVVGFSLVLLVLAGVGLVQGESARLQPLAPHGWDAVGRVCAPAFFAFLGFGIIIDLGGEVRRPRRNIPIALAASFIAVLGLYCAVTLAFILLTPPSELAGARANLLSAAGHSSLSALPGAVAAAALAACATSVNGIFLAFSREVGALAQAGILPGVFAGPADRNGASRAGIALMGALAFATTLAGAAIIDYATLAAAAILLQQILLALAARRLPMHGTLAPAALGLRMPHGLVNMLAWLAISGAAMMIVLSLGSRPGMAALLALLAGSGWLVYRRIERGLLQQGIDVRQRLTQRIRSQR